MMWYLVTKNRCVCVCGFLVLLPLDQLDFVWKKNNEKLEETVFFVHAVSMENGTHIIPPKKPCWTVNEPFQRGPPQLQLSLNRPTSDLPRGLMVNSMALEKAWFFFPHGIFQGERDMTWPYVIICCYVIFNRLSHRITYITWNFTILCKSVVGECTVWYRVALKSNISYYTALC